LVETEDELTTTKDKLQVTESRLVSTENKATTLMDTMLQHLIRSTGSNDRLILSAKWMLRITSMAALLVSGIQVCPVIVKMMEFSHFKGNGYEWFSDPFYSHDGGYKLCFSINPSGWERVRTGAHMMMDCHGC